MHVNPALVEMRVERFVRERLEPATYRSRVPLEVTAWVAPGEPVPFAEAAAARYETFAPGTAWGRPWGTTWFRLTGRPPEGFGGDGTRAEVVVDLGYSDVQPGFQAEATAYRPDGTVVKGLHPRNRYLPLAAVTGADGAVDVLLEASSNPDVSGDGVFATPTRLGDPATAGTEPLYRFAGAHLAELDVEVWELQQDVWTLRGLLAQLPESSTRRAEVLRALDDAVDAVDPWDVAGTAHAGRAALAGVLAQPASASAHRVTAVGHAHIDSAWLWPTRETARKCARTFSNVLALMDEDPDLVFACSSAQQYAWVRDAQPELFERIKKRVAEGRFVPVGGMWVESDTNMPGGEALARQFVAGKRFFAEEFGVEPLDVWLPDSFGYTAALPQIAVAAGARWFLTQKPSWNEVNRMPHHTFAWEGVDGTRIFTHFPPADTYNSDLGGEDLARAERQFAEKGRARSSLLPFGYGDGGGGPTREMLAAAARTRSLEGSPVVEVAGPHDFFRRAEAEYPDPPVWSGEVYLEFHRGTYTSQARTKRGNRRSEHLLREAELWATAAHVQRGADYPYEALERLWRVVLLQQFHDILPGSSIAWVHREAEARYAEVAAELEELIGTSLGELAGAGDDAVAFNASPFPRHGVAALGAAAPQRGGAARASSADGGFVLENDRVRVAVDRDGLLSSVLDLAADREVLAPGAHGGLLQLHRDTPTQWDAWDVDEHYRRHTTDLVAAESVELVEESGERVAVRVVRRFGDSRVEQVVSLAAGAAAVELSFDVDWHERQKLLKLAFPLDVHADRAASEIQFGHVLRPTHANTSWDAARFETCAHRWVHVGESGYGVAVANDSTYGHDTGRTTRPDGGTTTTVRLSLLRAPLFPDPDADQGRHVLRTSLLVGAGIPDAVREGYRLNLPLREVRGEGPVDPLFAVEGAGVVVEAVKLAEDRSGDVVVRLYEAHGGRARATVRPSFAAAAVTETDLLERDAEQPRALREARPDAAVLELRPFQIATLRWRRA
ncbi:glycosyl hydrolase-related protein [Paenibacillus sp. TRM 82003]|uniref:alpha-mannosidase n=1 Tax=Kineococcus sp. TRM81007 TaxID=2925831 RepID=UPI001F5A3395|nr:glycoside hydrolase family 38 C-terminal domain-containing protein [Kineococcus sp. TRM81007]MCI2237170.1 glycosyl hydrolase-related protein [Kineococcus sp. TRM81007]MCI3925291.1 glycosyl hydrolase-related protein [Paenibacillus sp. TRM 82003]